MKKNKYIVNIVIVSILLISSIVMYLCYPTIHNTVVKNANKDYAISDYASQYLNEYNYLIDLKIKNQDVSEKNLNQYIKGEGSIDIDEYNPKEQFYSRIYSYQDYFNNENGIKYYAMDTKTNEVASNAADNLLSIKNDKTLLDKYQWYIEYQYDANGSLSVEGSSPHDFLYQGQSKTISYQYEYASETGTVTFENPKDITIVYAVENDIEDGRLSSFIQSSTSSDYFRYAFVYVAFISFIVFLIVLLTPYKYLEEMRIFSGFARIKFEFLAFIWCPFIALMARLSGDFIYISSTDNFAQLLSDFGITHLSTILSPIMNIVFWFVLFYLIAFFAYMIRYFFKKGFVKYFKENTVIGWIVVHSERLIDRITNIDLNDNVNKAVLKIVLFNFVIMTIISVFFVFGAFFALIYSIIIFIILKQKFNRIQDQYSVLLHATKQLSSGNFDVQIDEDVGIFNPLKDEFSHIKEGFEMAVNEEVKSQKMKTELISNVSHDLKTPLTSIITYVDLLKNDQLSLEDKNNYLQILERNSLRLKNLIDDLFEVSKANSGDIHLDFIEVDIISLIKQAQLECLDNLEEKHLDIRLTYNQDKIICLLDSSKTYRIFENLLINIGKYALMNTRVYIDITENDDYVIITFKNISESEMKFNENEIVERFVQGDQSRNTSGSGLGLAIVKSFTELQNGQFDVEIDGDLFKSIIKFRK